MKKNIIAWGILVLLISVIGWGYYFGFKWDVSNANPDYICIKSVSNQSCVVSSWWAWQSDWTRVGTGTKATKVSYYATRTGCEPGYAGTIIWSIWGASWRRTADVTYSSTTCTITQIDKVAPIWTFK